MKGDSSGFDGSQLLSKNQPSPSCLGRSVAAAI
jgi:hypothetical protein